MKSRTLSRVLIAVYGCSAKLQRVRRTTLPEGLLLDIKAPLRVTLTATTKLGDLEIALAQLRRERALSVLDGKVRLQLLPNTTALTGKPPRTAWISTITRTTPKRT